ncbi:hypothetical protein IJH72_02840 [Candidatus Saccharibacteria bacterium]|nr:hypothetical protein [Candidatus Saccharibacteria bacterium]
MKKLAIAGASAVLAALPVVGVFADGNTVVDTVEITISSACGVASTSSSPVDGAGANLTATMVNGSTHTWAAAGTAGTGEDATGGNLYVTCNDASGWNVTAQGYSNNTAGTTSMITTTTGATAIPTGTDHLDGTASQWAFKIANDGITDLSIVTGYDSWSQVPTSATKIASLANTATSNGHIYTGYKVSVSPTQQAATYTGKVKYVVSAGVGGN